MAGYSIIVIGDCWALIVGQSTHQLIVLVLEQHVDSGQRDIDAISLFSFVQRLSKRSFQGWTIPTVQASELFVYATFIHMHSKPVQLVLRYYVPPYKETINWIKKRKLQRNLMQSRASLYCIQTLHLNNDTACEIYRIQRR